jgi:acyl carrier protein
MSSLEDLQTLIHEKFGIDPATLDPNTSMRESGLDSLALVEFLFAVEDQFGISMPDTQDGIDTLAQLAQLVDKLRAAQAA